MFNYFGKKIRLRQVKYSNGNIGLYALQPNSSSIFKVLTENLGFFLNTETITLRSDEPDVINFLTKNGLIKKELLRKTSSGFINLLTFEITEKFHNLKKM